MSCDHCTQIGIPESLCSEGKLQPLDFIPNELLYRRHDQPGTEVELKALSENEIGNKIFKMNDDSFNRSSLSTPEQVLLNDTPTDIKGVTYYDDWGIISLVADQVNSLNKQFDLSGRQVICTLSVQHTVMPCNYSHAEVFFYIDGERYMGKAPKSVRTLFRRELQKLLNVVKAI